MADPPLILLVEDNETIRNAFALLLEDSGYRVEHAGTGKSALERAEGSLPDLILMDLGLPDLHGLEVTRRLKANPETRSAVIIALTGRTLEKEQQACIDAGCSAFLAKPVDSARLLELIAEKLGEQN